MFNPGERMTESVSTAELERRWKLARKAMADKGVDILVMRCLEEYLGSYVRWFTDIPARHTYPFFVIFPKDDEMTIVSQGPFPPGEPYPPAWSVRGVKQRLNSPFLDSLNWTIQYEADLALSELKKTPSAKIGWVGLPHIPAPLYNAITKEMPKASFVDMTEEIDLLKAVKSPEEQELCVRSAEMQDKIYEYLKTVIQPGIKESDIYAHAHYMGTKLGSERGLILVGSAPKGKPARFKYRRYQNRVLQDGDQVAVLVELNGPGGMYTEIARPFSLGKPHQELVDAFGISLEAQELALSMLKPGADPAAIHNACNDLVVKRGSEPELRICLHGQGYDLVERPMFQNGETMLIAEGMNITLHPSGLKNNAWATVCDNYLVGKNGPGKCIHKFPKEITVL